MSLIKNIINFLIQDKKLQSKIKLSLKKYISRFKKMKLGASYSLWEGEELLEASVKSIRESCDYINVVYQKISWKGEACSSDLEEFLCELKSKGLIDEIILFEPNLKLPPSNNELNKRNLGLKYVKKANCTHFLTMDTDEFYKKDEFEIAKQYILDKGITHSICNLYNYSSINCRDANYIQMYASFIHKINQNSKLVKNCCSPVPWLVDPTRQFPITLFSKPCVLSNIVMHHYCGVRKDIEKKLRNSPAICNEEQKNAFLKWQSENIENKIAKGTAVKVDNLFDIKID